MESEIYKDIPTSWTTPSLTYDEELQRSITLIKELSPQEHLKEQMAWLEGKIWNNKTKNYDKVEGINPLMNQEGRDVFFQFATAVLSPIVTMSNYSTDYKRIHALVRMQIRKASVHFHLHWRDYEITKKTKIALITDKLMILGLSAFYKAIGAGDRKAGTSHVSENITTSSREGSYPSNHIERRGGILSRFGLR